MNYVIIGAQKLFKPVKNWNNKFVVSKREYV